MCQPLPCGNAVRLSLTLSAGAEWQRILRRTDDAFVGPMDPAAVLVVDQSIDDTLLDTTGLINGTVYFYRSYAWIGGAFVAEAVVSATPAATYGGDTFDPQTVVRERVALGMAVEVAAGRLKPAKGNVPVLTAPFALQESVYFPVISVHMDNESPGERGMGEEIAAQYGSIGDPEDSTGWLRRVRLGVVGVSLNSDERIALRSAIKRVILANMGVFDDAGMVLITFSQSDSEEFTEKGVPLFMTVGTFECLSPTYVTEPYDVLIDADVNVETINV